MNVCVECVYRSGEIHGALCNRYADTAKVDRVTGEPVPRRPACKIERSWLAVLWRGCGPSGRHWRAKNVIVVPPQKKAG